MFCLATDDICAFTCQGRGVALREARQIDEALEAAGVEANHTKEVTAVRDGTCIGIDLVEGRYLAPQAAKHLLLLSALAYVSGPSGAVSGTPNQLAALCGSAGWFCQLDRMLYSSFDAVYAFTHSQEPASRPLPGACRHELWSFAVLSVSLRVDLQMPWLNKVVASDASPVYGFGASVAPMSTQIRQRLLAAEGAQSRYVALPPEEEEAEEAPRSGTPVYLPMRKSAFTAENPMPSVKRASLSNAPRRARR